jgi:large subunit ribosomal protein L17
MRHQNAGRKFDRNSSSRRAMFRNLAANLVLHERIETTDAKAKEVRRVAERLITKARRIGEAAYTPWDKLSAEDKARRLATKRLLAAYIPRWGVRTEPGGKHEKVDLVEKVLIELAKRFKDRNGGYTRMVKLGPRRGDAAPMTILELMPSEDGEAKKGGDKKKKAAKAKKETAEAAAAG